jgi:hypothetical protein
MFCQESIRAPENLLPENFTNTVFTTVKETRPLRYKNPWTGYLFSITADNSRSKAIRSSPFSPTPGFSVVATINE